MALSRIGSLMVAVSGLVLAAPSMAGIEQGAAPATGGAKRLSEPVRIAALPAQPQVGDAEHGAGKAARSSAILPAQDVPSHALSAQRTAVRLAQAAPSPNGQAVQQGAGRGSSSTSTPGTSSGDVLAPVTDWLEKSAHDFQNVIIRKLSVPTGNAAEAKPQPVKAGETPPAVVPAAPKAATGSGVVAQAPAPAAKPEQPGTGMSGMGGLSGMAGGIADQVNSAIEKAQSWFNDARREFQKDVVKKLEQPETAKPGGMAGQGGTQPTAQIEPPPAAKIEPGKTTEPAASGQTAADAAKKAADDEAAKRAAEAAANRKLEALAKEEAAARKKAEAEAAAAKKAEEKRLAEEAAARKKAEAEAAAAAKKAEEKRIAEEAAARKKAEAEAAAAKKAEEKRLAEEAAARKKAEADAAAAVKKAEEKRIADEAAAKKADEAAAKAATAAAAAKMAAEASRKADEILKPGDGSGNAAKATGGGSAAPAPTSPAPTSPAPAGGSTSSAAVATARRADVAEARGASRRGGRVTHARTCRNAGRKVTPPAVYVVARGDTLWDIAERHYRNGMRYVGVYRANSTKIDDPDLIYPCQKVYLPKLR